jgi:hypothetical protein
VLEGEPRIAELVGLDVGVLLVGMRRAPAAVLSRSFASPRATARLSSREGGLVGLALQDIHGGEWPKDGHGTGPQQPPEAFADPSTCLWRGFEDEPLTVDLPEPQRLEPYSVGRFVDCAFELALHLCPDLLQFCAHGSVDPLLGEGVEGHSQKGVREDRGAEYIPSSWSPCRLVRRTTQLARKTEIRREATQRDRGRSILRADTAPRPLHQP